MLDRMAARLASRPGILAVRRETVEHPFGSIKQRMNQGACLMRGLEKVRAEFSLTALACGLQRAITIIGVSWLIRAVQALFATVHPPRRPTTPAEWRSHAKPAPYLQCPAVMPPPRRSSVRSQPITRQSVFRTV